MLITFIISLSVQYEPLKEAGINLKSTKGIITSVKVYFSWLNIAFDNVRTITANAIRLNWQPDNGLKELKNKTR